MSAHRMGFDEYKLLEAGGIVDPGNGGVIDLNAQSGMVLKLSPAGNDETRVLPENIPAGVTLMVVVQNSATGTLIIDSADDVAVTVAALSAGIVMSTGAASAGWAGVALPVAPV